MGTFRDTLTTLIKNKYINYENREVHRGLL
jgi:hypothetical protein